MYDLEKELRQGQDKLRKAEELRDVLNRPDEDFIVYVKWDGSLGSFMRWKRCPLWFWKVCKFILLFASLFRRRPKVSDFNG